MTSKELQKRWKARVDEVQNAFFTLDSKNDIDSRVARARKDYAYFVETYFPHLAKSKCGKFQLDAGKYLLKNKRARAVFEWARGHAKSTHVSLLIPMWLMIQERKQFNMMVLVSKSEDAAVRLLSDLQAELQFNALFNHDFGDQPQTGSWEEGEFRTQGGFYFVALGRGQSPRGLKDRSNRPDYIVIDDIDDDEMCRNEARVDVALDWLLTALMGTMAMGRGRVTLVGNRIHKKSILAKLVKRPNFYHTIINALDKKGLPSWKENYTSNEISELRETIGERAFQKEYMNNPIEEGVIFQEKYIQFGKMLPLKKYAAIVCYTDPSFKSSTKNDFKATMLLGKTKEGYYHLIKAYADQTTVSNMVQWHYDIDDFVKGATPVMYYMEANFLQDLLLEEFKTFGATVGHQIPVRGDKRKKPDKFARIEALQPLFERGFFLFNEKEKDSQGMRVLIEQLLAFQKGSKVHDDAPDALEGGVFLLQKRTATKSNTYRVGRTSPRKF
ncbi:phage terminase large subunit [Flammeovirga sp. MY04]|uniref:phage terminase large subunit n=1 Tax=Flammeovirga sp. MY04 TaxID=1191459 RepID=UPI0008061AE5|nr:phage terminase large subunit [Flammeovirga sp. MY04]ANQ49608.1 phage terminase large subunit [Flammeovirga sp. MY04]ANQ52126.1 phage terminase large subunit [Flammeovirga sp. MY04]